MSSLAVSAPAVAAPTTLHVNAASGSDSNECTAAAPCLTIGHAISQAASGDTISIAAGDYTEDLQISGTSLTLAGTSGVDLVDSFIGVDAGASLSLTGLTMSGTGNGANSSLVNHGTTSLTDVEVQGKGIANDGTLTVQGSRFGWLDEESAAIIQIGSAAAQLTVRDSTFTHRSWGVLNAQGTAVIDSSTFAIPSWGATYGAAVTTGSTDTSVQATTVVTNSTISRTATGISTLGSGETLVVGTTIVDPGYVGILLGPDGSTTVAGSVIQNGGWAPSPYDDAADCVVTGNTVTDAGHNTISDDSCGVTASTSTQSVDPQVQGAGDFGGATATAPLASSSPAVDQIPTSATVTWHGDSYALCDGTDQRGVQRPQATTCDQGSMELIATTIDVDDVDVTVGQDTNLHATMTAASAPTDVPGLSGSVRFSAAGSALGGCSAVTVTSTSVTCPHTFNAEIDDTLTAAFSSTTGYRAATATATVTAAAPAGTTVRHVATDGTDTGDCSVAACATLAYAQSQAVGGDTVLIGPGTFDTSNATITKDLTLLGDPDGSFFANRLTTDPATKVTIKQLNVGTALPTVLDLDGEVVIEDSTLQAGLAVGVRDDATFIRSTVARLVPTAAADVTIIDSTMIDAQPNAATWAAGSVFEGGDSGGDACHRNLNIGTKYDVQDGGHNLAADDTCGLPVQTGLLQGTLADHGGPTLTMVPGSDSPLVDAIPSGTTVTHGGTTYPLCGAGDADQRGVVLPQGDSCDIGAVELAASKVSLTPDNNAWVGEDATVTATVRSAGSGADLPAPAGTVTFTRDGTEVCTDVALSGGTATCAISGLPDGSTAIDVTYTSTNGYRAASGSGTQRVDTLTVSLTQPDDAVYGDDVPVEASSPSGFDVSLTSLTPLVCDVANGVAHADAAGTCTIGAHVPPGSGHPGTAMVVRSFEVAPAPLTITPYAPPADYGASGGLVLFPIYSGLKNGDTEPQTPPTCTIDTATLELSCSGAADPNYTITYNTGTLTINPVPLTITASDESMQAGDALPTVTPSYDGLVNGDTAPATPPTCTADQTTGTTSCAGAVDPHYDITYVDGTLTVTDPPTIGFPPLADAVYGTSTTLIATTTPPLSIVFTTATTDVCTISGSVLTAVGVGTCTVTASADEAVATRTARPAAAARAARLAPVTHSFQVVAAPLTITAADASMTEGDPLPTVTPSYRGLVNGDTAPATPPTCTADDTTDTTTCTGAADPNYDISYVPGRLTVTPADAPDDTSADTSGGTATPPPSDSATPDGTLPDTGGPVREVALAGLLAILAGLVLLHRGRPRTRQQVG